MSTISRNERGQVMAFVVVIVMALLLFVALVFDGGLILAAKRRAINQAEAAARAGAQAIATNTYRTTGRLTLDPVQARAAARAMVVTALARNPEADVEVPVAGTDLAQKLVPGIRAVAGLEIVADLDAALRRWGRGAS
jgi:hypothetical protein